MKLRGNTTKLVVDGRVYQYMVTSSATTHQLHIIIYDDKDVRHVIDPRNIDIPDRDGVQPTWRGKHADKAYGKYEVNCIIKQLKL